MEVDGLLLAMVIAGTSVALLGWERSKTNVVQMELIANLLRVLAHLILLNAPAVVGLNVNLTLTVSSKPSVVLTELIANLSHALNPITPTNAGVTACQIAVQATLSNAQTDREAANLFVHLAGNAKTAIQ